MSSTSNRCTQEDEEDDRSCGSIAFGSDDEDDAAVELSEISLSGSQYHSSSLDEEEEEEDEELVEFALQIGADSSDKGSQHVAAHSASISPLPSPDLQRLHLGSSTRRADAVPRSDATAGMDEAAESERHNASAQLRSFVEEAERRCNALHWLAAEERAAAASGRPSVIPGQRIARGEEPPSLRYTLNWH
jgi:hypothetical protein